MIDIIQFEPAYQDKEFFKALGYSEIYQLTKLKKIKIIYGGDDSVNRKAVETKNIILLNPHNTRTKDFMHFRNSGLNHILCRLASDNNVIIAFSLDKMYDSNDLGRVMQSVKLCRKYKCKIAVFSFARNKYELRSANDIAAFLNVVGFDSGQIKQILEFRI